MVRPAVQSNRWCELVGAREGAEVPLPLDLVDMGMPEGLTGTVLSIQQCPQPPPGPGRLVLTTVNHLNRDVIELDLRGADGKLETLRPTGNHKFYSVTRNEWLSAGELREGEQLDGVDGLVTVESKRTLPGTQRVYNLTVQGEHLYRVAHSGVLVHNTCPGQLAQPGEDLFVGTYNQVRAANLKSGLNLTHTPHHAIQDAITDVSRGRGITINLRKDLHTFTRTFCRRPDAGVDLRTHLARDVKDLRRILFDAGYDRAIVNRQLRELIRLNKLLYGL